MILFNIGKMSTLLMWLPVVWNLLLPLPAPWDYYVMVFGVIMFAVHFLEWLVVYGKLKARGHGGMMDMVMVILVGLFHWLPIVKQPELSGE